MRKIAMLLALCLMLSALAGCSGGKADVVDPNRTESYTLKCGATITAPANMKETDMDGYTACLDSKDVALLLLEEGKPDGYTLVDYAFLICMSNDIDEAFSEDACGNMATSYVAESNGDDWFYYVTILESPTSFWLCQFACKVANRSKYGDLFAQWSATLEVPGGRMELNTGKEIDFTTYDLACGVTLPGEKSLNEFAVDGVTAFYSNDLSGFSLILEEKYEGMSLADYADAICQVNGYDAMQLNAYGNYWTEHTYTDGADTFWYYTTVHEISDGFIMLQYFCYEETMDIYRPYFEIWSAALTETN